MTDLLGLRGAVASVTLALVVVAAGGATEPDDPRYGLLSPLPDRGGVPPIVEMMYGPTPAELAERAQARAYAKEIRRIAHEHLGDIRVDSIRQAGIAELRRFDDPAAFMPLISELSREKDDVRLAVVDHFAGQAEPGQAALAWLAIYDEDPGIRYEATRRMATPAPRPVLHVLDAALRNTRHEVVNNAGALAGALNAAETIPLLIFAQVASDRVEKKGDLAWIAIQTQRPFVARLEPVVGDGAGAFQPIVGIVNEGVILRVVDAVVVIYRTEVHRSLVAMTSREWGRSTEDLGYDLRGWWKWYNLEYVPFVNERARREALAAGADRGDPDQPEPGPDPPTDIP